jgi:hypothetical protein
METIKDKIITENVNFENWKGSIQTLESIGLWVDFRNWKGSAPNLESISWCAYFRNWKGSAPKLKSIGRKPFIWRGDL